MCKLWINLPALASVPLFCLKVPVVPNLHSATGLTVYQGNTKAMTIYQGNTPKIQWVAWSCLHVGVRWMGYAPSVLETTDDGTRLTYRTLQAKCSATGSSLLARKGVGIWTYLNMRKCGRMAAIRIVKDTEVRHRPQLGNNPILLAGSSGRWCTILVCIYVLKPIGNFRAFIAVATFRSKLQTSRISSRQGLEPIHAPKTP